MTEIEQGRRYGVVGGSLASKSSRQNLGKTVEWGQKGEVEFARQCNDPSSPLYGYDLFYSLRIPGSGSPADVDVVAVSGDRILLIDVKFYSANKVYWRSGKKVMENFGVKQTASGKDHTVTESMMWARDMFRQKFPQAHVDGIVCFVKTGRNYPRSVALLTWPGDVRSYKYPKAARIARKYLGTPERADVETRGAIGYELKHLLRTKDTDNRAKTGARSTPRRRR